MKPMSDQLSFAAIASVAALAALCLSAPTLDARSNGAAMAPVAAMADAGLPAIALPSLLPR